MSYLYNKLNEINRKVDKIKELDELEFPVQAANILKSTSFENPVSDEEVIELSLNIKHPKQYYAEKQFGEFNITVFYYSSYSIQVYIMNSIDTEVHDHGFVGAFQVLNGENIHSEYSFSKEKTLEEDVSIGSLSLVQTKKLKTFDVAPLCKEGIHQITRTGKSNITLMVMKHTGGMNSFFLPPKVKVCNQPISIETKRNLFACSYLFSNQKPFERKMEKLLEELILREQLYLLIRIQNFPFEDDFKVYTSELLIEILENKELRWIYDDYKKYLKKQKAKSYLLKS